MEPLRPVSFTRVRHDRGFWAQRIETNRSASIPTALDKCRQSGRLDNFERAARALRGERLEDTSPPGFPFDDTDVYKLLEGAAYALAVRPDAVLEERVDALIALVASAQEADGYLFTTRTLCPAAPHRWAGTQRWELETQLSHELYNLGHLYEAAVAHHEATGKRSLLDVALRSAQLLEATFGPGKRAIWPGHQITEMGLVRLYGVTRNPAQLELARFFLDQRGPDGNPGSGDPNNQSHARVVDQTEAVGHAVRATYMYAGMADVARESGANEYVSVLDRIWHDIVSHKLYLTGGIGARKVGEAFGAAYELPNLTAYSETCAAIGLVYFAHRMFLLHGCADAIDVLERTLYNGLLAGVSLDGESYFYPNPLESFGEHARSPWFGCACCPGNVARFLASVPGYSYAQRGSQIYVNLFAAGSAQLELGAGERVELVQATDYPWDGRVQLLLCQLSRPRTFAISLRIPGWARADAVPSDLYRFADNGVPPPSLSINGEAVSLAIEAGYVTLERCWQSGDTIELVLPMPVRRVLAHPRVSADVGRVALQRGPLVYALEGHDHERGEVGNLVLSDQAALQAELRKDLLGGVVAIRGAATALSQGADGPVRRATSFTAIPYFAWANRGPCQMQVWVAREE